MNIANTLKCFFLLLLSSACVDMQSPEMDSLEPSDVFAEVKIRSEAIMIAEGDSHQIEFELIAMNEDAIPLNPDAIKWTSAESNIVSVSNTGVIQGLQVSSSPIIVEVKYTHKYVTMFDTVRVYVTDGKIDADGIRLISLDSSRVGGTAAFGAPRIRVDLYKTGALVKKGSLIPIQIDPPAEFRVDGTGGPDSEPVYRITNSKILIGKFWIRASLNLYGVEVEDSLQFTGLYGDQSGSLWIANIPADYNAPVPVLDTMPLPLFQPCSIVAILNLSSIAIDVIFSDSMASSTECAAAPASYFPPPSPILTHLGEFIGGNVINVPPWGQAIRRSSTLGVIEYSVRKTDTKQIIPWYANHFKQVDVNE